MYHNREKKRYKVTISRRTIGKKILKELSREQYITGFENPALFFPAT